MKLFQSKIKTISFRKKKRFNPHRAWIVFCVSFIGSIVVLLGYLSWYFLETTQTLDAPVAANLETNASNIASMQKTLDDTEAAVRARIGTQSSQN